AHAVFAQDVDAVRRDPDTYAVIPRGRDGEIGQPWSEEPQQRRDEVDHRDVQTQGAAGRGDLHAEEAAAQHDRTSGAGKPAGEGALGRRDPRVGLVRLVGQDGHLSVEPLCPQALRRRQRGDGPAYHDDPLHGWTFRPATGQTRTAAATMLSRSGATSSWVR